MAGAVGLIAVEGLADLTKTFKHAPKDVRLAYRKELRTLGEPIRTTAERLAVSEIRKIGPKWLKFRTGVTQTLVYVAPRQRGVKARGDLRARPNLGRRLADEVTNPALEQNKHRIESDIDDMLDRLVTKWDHEGRRAA